MKQASEEMLMFAGDLRIIYSTLFYGILHLRQQSGGVESVSVGLKWKLLWVLRFDLTWPTAGLNVCCLVLSDPLHQDWQSFAHTNLCDETISSLILCL